MLLIIFSNYVSHLLQLKCTQVPAQGGAAKKNCSPIINREHKKSRKLVEDSCEEHRPSYSAAPVKGSFISYWRHKRSNNHVAVRTTPMRCVNPNSSGTLPFEFLHSWYVSNFLSFEHQILIKLIMYNVRLPDSFIVWQNSVKKLGRHISRISMLIHIQSARTTRV